jgi:hypothetical protein
VAATAAVRWRSGAGWPATAAWQIVGERIGVVVMAASSANSKSRPKDRNTLYAHPPGWSR